MGIARKNALTIDVEDWYMTHDFNFDQHLWDSFEDRVEGNTRTLLGMLAQLELKATFFVLGCVALKHPALIREIASAGHEIASHGTWHRKVSLQSRREFRADVRESKIVLEDLVGREVNIYRAPSWSISEDSLWSLEILEEEGFICDSSVQPFKTPLSGISNAPVFPYHPVVNGRRLNLIEFPPTVLEFGGMRLPFAGGFYFRVMPRSLFRWALRRVNAKRVGMFYLHPWEIDEEQPNLQVSPLIKMIHYWQIGATYAKAEQMLKAFNFVPLGEMLTEDSFPALPVIKIQYRTVSQPALSGAEKRIGRI